jgi:hypothetical protein
MPGKNQKPRRWSPKGLSDAVDGSDAFAGAMSQLQNVIRQPNSTGVFVPRPAMTSVAAIPNYNGGPVTGLKTLGNTAFGFASTQAFAGKDAPFMYDAASGAFVPITGLSSANLPNSPLATGEWTPPTIDEITSRVIFTHPGFAGGASLPTSFIGFTANIASGSNVLAGPFLFSAAIGSLVSDGVGGLIPANTTITNIVATAVMTTASGSSGANTVMVGSATGIAVGQALIGPGVNAIVSNVAGTTITFNSALTMNISGVSVAFYGTNITISNNATGTSTGAVLFAWSPVAIKFGWLDISGFSVSNIIGNTTIDIPGITGSPNLVGLQPGMSITGAGILANTTIISFNNVSFPVFALTVVGTQTLTLTSASYESAIAIGQTVSGPGIPPGSTVLAYNPAAYAVTISQAATVSSIGGVGLTFSGSFIIMSQNATSSNSLETLTVAGGTPGAPLWGAGDLNINPLASNGPAIFVSQFANRAYYGVNVYVGSATIPLSVGVQASDAGLPCQQTNISQTLTFDNGIPVTAAAGLGLNTQLGGIIQSLMVFQGDSNIQQITGDFASQTIQVNPLQTATGTLSPNSLSPSPKGLLFVATDGLRLIGFDGTVSDPIGAYGKGLTLPFLNTLYYSRIAAAFNENVYRVTVGWTPPAAVASVWGTALRTDEFWFHIDIGTWSGPHTSLMDLIAPLPRGNTFLCAPQAARGSLYRSDVNPSQASAYSEFGAQLTWVFTTALLPDNPGQMAISMSQTTVLVGLVSGSEELLATVTDDMGVMLAQAYVWIGPFSVPAQRPILWPYPLVYRQMRLSIAGASTAALQLGAINLRDEVLSYQLPYPVSQEWILGQTVGGVLGP